VSGANLRKRIETIMAGRIARNLDVPRKLMLVAAGTATVIAPIAISLLNAPASQAQSPSPADQPVSYLASVKPNNDGSGGRDRSLPSKPY
jgi:hypothetical protein